MQCVSRTPCVTLLSSSLHLSQNHTFGTDASPLALAAVVVVVEEEAAAQQEWIASPSVRLPQTVLMNRTGLAIRTSSSLACTESSGCMPGVTEALDKMEAGWGHVAVKKTSGPLRLTHTKNAGLETLCHPSNLHLPSQ